MLRSPHPWGQAVGGTREAGVERTGPLAEGCPEDTLHALGPGAQRPTPPGPGRGDVSVKWTV